MTTRENFQNYVATLSNLLQSVILRNEKAIQSQQREQENSIDENEEDQEDIIPPPSYVCSINFAQSLRQFGLLNRVPKVDCQLKVQTLLTAKQQDMYPQIAFDKYFKRNITNQRLSQARRQKDAQHEYKEWPNIRQTKLYRIELPWKDKRLEIASQELLSLKQRKMIPERIVTNFFTLLKETRKISEKIEIAPFTFLPTLLQGIDEDEEREEAIVETVKNNFEKAFKCLKLSILQKTITVIPFVVYDHYAMVIVKGVPRILTKKDHKAVLIYCSSRYTADKKIFLALKTYLQMDIELTYGRGLKISDKNLDCTQLILPKQVYSADSGLFLMLSCQTLLADDGRELSEAKANYIQPKLHLFPLNLVQELREILWNFYHKLINCKEREKESIIEEYFRESRECQIKADLQHDYASVDTKEVQKLEILMNGRPSSNEWEKYQLTLEMCYNTSLNYYADE